MYTIFNKINWKRGHEFEWEKENFMGDFRRKKSEHGNYIFTLEF